MKADDILRNFERKPSISVRPLLSPKKLLGGLFVFVLAISSVLLAQRILKPVGKPEKSNAQVTDNLPWTYPRTVKAIAVEYADPASTQSYSKDPTALSVMVNNMIYLLNKSSSYHGLGAQSIDISLVDTYLYNEAAPSADQYPNWEDAYNAMLNRPLNHSGDNGKTLCDRILAENIDQIYFVADSTTSKPLVNGPEIAFSSKYAAGRPLTPFCGGTKTILVIYVDSSYSPNNQNPHAFGHLMERISEIAMGYDLFVKKFTGIEYDPSTGIDGIEVSGVDHSTICGNIHVPPNDNVVVGETTVGETSTKLKIYKGYVYDDPSTVMSSCPNWKPDGTGTPVPINSSSWPQISNSPYNPDLQFSVWWLQNIPNINNGLTYNGLRLPNWWDFVVDTDNTLDWYIDQWYKVGGDIYYLNPNLLLMGRVENASFCSSKSGSSPCTTSSL